MADLLAIQPHRAKCVIRAPYEPYKPIGLTIEMQSMKSDAVRKIRDKHAEENLALVKEGEQTVSGETLDRQATEKFATAITGWEFGKDHKGEQSCFGERDGKPYIPEYSFEAACDLLSKSEFIFSQVVDYGRVEAHFYANFGDGS